MNTNPNEKWKTIKGHDNYLISDFGNVYSIKTKKLLKSDNLRSGYKSVCIRDILGTPKAWKIHRLVALHFIPNEDSTKNNVNHIDGDKLNNNVSNLEWVTGAYNTQHAFDIGKNYRTLRSINQMDLEGNIIATFKSLKEATEKTGFSDASIVKVCRGTRQTAKGFKWAYAEINPNDGEIDLTHFIEVENFPNYKISKEGVIYNIKFKKILKQQTNADGYKVIGLHNDNIRKSYLVHRLVAEHFLPIIKGKNLVNHKDKNKTNNHANNLEWVTNSENIYHANNYKHNDNEKKPTKKSTKSL
mgnify:CR=1 FL=1